MQRFFPSKIQEYQNIYTVRTHMHKLTFWHMLYIAKREFMHGATVYIYNKNDFWSAIFNENENINQYFEL